MHITPVSLKNYSFHNLFEQIKLRVCLFLFKKKKKKKISPQKMCMSCLGLRHGTYLNGTSNVFSHLLIIFLGYDWLRFFLNK